MAQCVPRASLKIGEAPSGYYRPAVALVRGRLAGESAGALLGGLASSGRHDRLGGEFPGSRPQNPKSGIFERVDTRKGHMKK